MKKKRTLQILLGVVILLVVAVGGLAAYISYELRSEVLTRNIQELLSETLGTKVKLKDCNLQVYNQELTIHGLSIQDKKKVEMLRMDTIDAKVSLLELWHRRLMIKGFKLSGARLVLYKERKDSAANFQFVINAVTVISRNRTKEEVKKQKKAKLKWDVRQLELSNVSLKWDIKSEIVRSSPEFRRTHPKFGFFDPNHLDVNISLLAKNIYVEQDSSAMLLDHVRGYDRVSGLTLTELSTKLEVKGTKYYAHDLKVRSNETTVEASLISGVIPSKKIHKTFSLRADNVKIHAVLKDISRPFSLALEHFTTPVEATVNVVGTDSNFLFKDIHAFSDDDKLDIKAYGGITFPKMGTMPGEQAKYLTNVYFRVTSLHAKADIKKRIVGHFAKMSPGLATMLLSLGDVRFVGGIDIPYMHEHIFGLITTNVGKIKANVDLNEITKTMHGTVGSNGIDLATLTGKKDLKPVAFNASCDLDIAYHIPKTLLPIGDVKGTVLQAGYKGIHLKNIDFNIRSDGKNVMGCVDADRKLMDISCDFSFSGTDIKHTLKAKPHIKVHNVWKAIFGGGK